MTEHQVSIIIKTFQRPEALARLLASLVRAGVRYPVLVADDGRESQEDAIRKKFPGLDLSYIKLPFDSGLSAGRNALVKAVNTPYFVLCDDDYAFESRTDIGRALQILQTENADVIGGAYYNYVVIPSLAVFARQLTHPFRLMRFFLRRYKISRYIGNFDVKGNDCTLTVKQSMPAHTVTSCHLVNNFFVARTAAVNAIGGWDEAMKMGEHEDFFYRAWKHGLKVAYLEGFGVGHYPSIPVKNAAYDAYRRRAVQFKGMFARKHGFSSYREVEAESGKLLFQLSQ